VVKCRCLHLDCAFLLVTHRCLPLCLFACAAECVSLLKACGATWASCCTRWSGRKSRLLFCTCGFTSSPYHTPDLSCLNMQPVGWRSQTSGTFLYYRQTLFIFNASGGFYLAYGTAGSSVSHCCIPFASVVWCTASPTQVILVYSSCCFSKIVSLWLISFVPLRKGVYALWLGSTV
jgi:hypothetical protein